MTQQYVVGVCLDAAGRVLLMRKTAPEWQRGFLNGPGGKQEPGETILQAMEREFQEEVDLSGTVTWKPLATQYAKDTTTNPRDPVHYFRNDPRFPIAAYRLDEVQAKTPEIVEVWEATDPHLQPQLVPPMQWVLPLARDLQVVVPVRFHR